MKRVIIPILIFAFAGVMCFAGFKLWSQYSEYKTGEDAYVGLEQYVEIPTPPIETSTPKPSESEVPEPNRWDFIQWPEADFEEFAAVNPKYRRRALLRGHGHQLPRRAGRRQFLLSASSV